MCQGCVEDGAISAWLYDVVETFNRCYDDVEYGNGHIVLADCNVKDAHIEWCLEQPDDGARGPWKPFLRWMLTVPQEARHGSDGSEASDSHLRHP
jgi:hypothetical protein